LLLLLLLVFIGFGCYHTARSILRRIQIRILGKFPCTDHAVQDMFERSGLTKA
jgi:hypothetical protein